MAKDLEYFFFSAFEVKPNELLDFPCFYYVPTL